MLFTFRGAEYKMKIIPLIIFILTFIEIFSGNQIYCDQIINENLSNSIYINSNKNDAAKVSGNEWATKQAQRNRYEREGYQLAKQGQYEAAIVKFTIAADSALIVQEHEKGIAIGYIVRCYQRQGKFDKALKAYQWFIEQNKINDAALEGQKELLALIKARNTKNNKSIYDYIGYIKKKYPQYFPPNGYFAGMSGIYINDFIHLYDYMHDYDAGIAFMDGIIKYHTQHPDKNHRSAHAKDVREYTRVKQAWELDKKTGQHCHLQEVIKTSDIISW